ncbi:hypothetical protein [Salegentibacter flavus]|uniref:Nucleotidyl transferase AbiEii toxin, Type IV TA system n=1 Tax=Salegentibacter flavus TaxID=287099 RepID=A0A1I5C4A0_9FLAO|nr:hypothetical protein [Salegentibacter flavus]SFN81696.1 hypothetical protein SAMN05660413_02694 [Salegentibacter flavus]
MPESIENRVKNKISNCKRGIFFPRLTGSKLTKISWVDYSKHNYDTLKFTPPESIMEEYKRDYAAMEESMFYGKTEPFEDLIDKLNQLNTRINKIG